jgi:hypothetical protein
MSQRTLLKIICSSGEKFVVVTYNSSSIAELITLIELEYQKHTLNKSLTAKVSKFGDGDNFIVHPEQYDAQVGDIFQNNDSAKVVLTFTVLNSIFQSRFIVLDASSSEDDDISSNDDESDGLSLNKLRIINTPLDAHNFEDFPQIESPKVVVSDPDEDPDQDRMDIVVKPKPNGFETEILTFCKRYLIQNPPIQIKKLSKMLSIPHKEFVSKNYDHFTQLLQKFDDVFEVTDKMVQLNVSVLDKSDEIRSVIKMGMPDDKFIEVIFLYKDVPRSYRDFIEQYYVNFPNYLRVQPASFEVQDDRVRLVKG